VGESGWQVALPVIAILLAQVGLYVWMAPRGFDFTDEAYYFLNYLYWRDLIGTMSFFGAYFELPFRMLDQSVSAIRIFSLIVLLASSAFFSREAFAYIACSYGETNKAPWVIIFVGMASSMSYFGYMSTLRAPSYNLLTLCSMLVATGLLLRVLRPFVPHPGNSRLSMVLYGLAVGACGLGKASSGALLVVCHALFFFLANRDWRLRHLLEILALTLAGVSLNIAVLQYVHPYWLSVLREGIAMVNSTDGRGVLVLADALLWEMEAVVRMGLPWAVGVAGSFVLLVRWIGPSRRATLSTLVVALVGGCVLSLMGRPFRGWLPFLGLAALMLWSVEGINRKPVRLTRGDTTDFGLTVLLFVLPVAYSFGTDNSVLQHSQMAAVFVVTFLSIKLHRLTRLGLLTPTAMVVCFTALCIPTLVIQLKAATDVKFTYRQLSSLGDQSMPVCLGTAGKTLLVDASTRESLQSVIGTARSSGFKPGQTILDFTGDSPGLIFALGGRPLGTAWLLGGYPGSEATAARLLLQLSTEQLQSAWVISSDDNPRAIKGWQQLLNARLGADSHMLVGTVRIHAPYRWSIETPEKFTLHLWKPRAAAGLKLNLAVLDTSPDPVSTLFHDDVAEKVCFLVTPMFPTRRI
jgi:hypothetical protein